MRRLLWALPSAVRRLIPWSVRRRLLPYRRVNSTSDMLDFSAMPYREDFLDYLRCERASGRSLVLATASDTRYAQEVADHLFLFDCVFRSEVIF